MPKIEKQRSDEELQAALAGTSANVMPLLETQAKLTELRNELYKQYIAPIDAELYGVRRTILGFEDAKKQIVAELTANKEARETQERIRIQEEKRRIAAEGRRVYLEGLQQRLETSADALERQPEKLSRGLASTLRRVIDHPRFGEIAGSKIGVEVPGGTRMRVIFGEADSVYFLNYNPPSDTQVGKTVREITEEVANKWHIDEGEVIRDFIGFRVNANTPFPLVEPFLLIKQDAVRTSRLTLPTGSLMADDRFDAPVAAITQSLQQGKISLQTTHI